MKLHLGVVTRRRENSGEWGEKITRILNIVFGAIMGDAQVLSGVKEEIEESKHHVGSLKRQTAVHNMLLYRLFWEEGLL